jgi:hypothetical protein
LTRTAALVIALAAGVSAIAAPAAPHLQYRWTANQPSRYRLIAKVRFAAAGETDPVSASATLVYRVKPQRAAAKGATPLELAYESLDTLLLGQPIAVSDDQARKTLNKHIALAPTGEVVQAPKPPTGKIDFIPGVQPDRLYALLFPVVFPNRSVKPGDTWTYRSALLGTDAAPAPFTAQVAGTVSSRGLVEVRMQFGMDVNVAMNKDGKPVAEGEPAILTRKGRIDGSGRCFFDSVRGRLDHGSLSLKADITETRVTAKPEAPPETIQNRVDATISIALMPNRPAAAGKPRRR